MFAFLIKIQNFILEKNSIFQEQIFNKNLRVIALRGLNTFLKLIRQQVMR